MTYLIIFLTAVITILPIGLLYLKDIKINYLKISIWSLISLIINIFIIYNNNKLSLLNILVCLITLIISTLFNYCFKKDWIHPKNFFKLLIFLLLFLFSSIFQLIPISLFNLNIKNLSNVEQNYLTLFSNIILLIIYIIIYRKDLKQDIINFKNKAYEHLDTAFKYWLIGLIIMVVSNLIINLFATQAIAGNEQKVQSLIGCTPILSVLTIGIIAPFIEEMTFRKIFYDAFNNKKLFIIISGLVFGGLHIVTSFNSAWDLLYLIPYCSLGFAFAIIMTKTKNIFASTSMHMFHNTILTILSIVGSMVIMLW